MPTQPSGLSPKTQFQNRIYQRTDRIGDAIDAIGTLLTRRWMLRRYGRRLL